MNKWKLLWVILCFSLTSMVHSQPTSDEYFKLRLENLEKAIKKHPRNDSLMWERIELSINGFPSLDEVMNFEFTETRKKMQ